MLASEYELNERDHALGHYRVYDTTLLCKHLEDAGFTVLQQGGYFLKPLSNAQMEAFFTPAMLDGFYAVSEYFPQHCAEIFAVCASK
ncbi:MAG: hypothetical protein KatS3mg032_0003 [Cyclobacteriaceae bacterium]|nr:MAG: hypothetical protein KatS3mg032_0003 [Cyclobacteriaceae bacterium]